MPAQEEMTKYLEEHNLTPQIRIYVAPPAGCGGSEQLTLALDGPHPGDTTHEEGGITYSINTDLLQAIAQVTIDFREEDGDRGFVLMTDRPLPVSDSHCGKCTSCG